MKAAPLIGISRHRLSTDGEGVTTLVAFHGCPLRCKYCLNPQSLHSEGIWKNYDCEQLYDEFRQDELYFLATNGGITFGGGEPCLQSDFIYEFRQLCGQEWQLSVETSLNVTQENIEKLVPVVDSYIIDIKEINNTLTISFWINYSSLYGIIKKGIMISIIHNGTDMQSEHIHMIRINRINHCLRILKSISELKTTSSVTEFLIKQSPS